MPRLHSMVLWKAIVLTTLCAAGIWSLWWWGLVHSPRTQVRDRARQSLVQMDRTIGRELNRAETTGLAFGAWWSREEGRLDDPARLQGVIAFLERGAIITNLILSREDGDSACVVRRDGEWNLVLYRAGRHPRRFMMRSGKWVPGPADDREVYDARQRYWYRFGAAHARPAWTPEAYRYYTSMVGGFTYTVPVRNSQGRLEGVIGVDVSLEELTALIWEHQPTPGARLMVTDLSGRLLVPPRTPEMLDQGTRFRHQLTPSTPPGDSRPGSSAAVVRADGAYSTAGTPQMRLQVAIPEEDLFPGLHRRRIATFLLALALVLGVAWSLLDLHRHLVRPMRELAAEAGLPGSGSAPGKDYHSDIWELEQVGRQLRDAGRAVQEKELLLSRAEHNQRMDSVGMMAPGIVHDVNNHLAVVLGQLTLCRSQSEGHPALQPRLRAAEGATIKCAEVLRGLLDYSRPDPGQRVLMNLNTSLETGIGLLRGVLGKGIRVELDLDPELPMLFGDPVKIQQIIVNLGINARDAMPLGGLLSFRTFSSEGNACLEVRDTGCGMDDDVKRRIFEPYFSTKEPGKGTGLGLAMVANIVTGHGGRIQVDSEPGAGTTFRIELPPSLRKGAERTSREGRPATV
ncbi:sensor histidine kinase [Geothrix sp. 21YS21S-2]|uniref:sensor histidine kinase n=1 Tax=Geothrix sp. 21YS21S-2 TaxID=3068893 RepID=UPI0027B96AFC|nr:sensor histidine kinase [Geothrix sp. 21YS21S-2]